jgi:RNA polymerase sigma factor (sigma-70 family)
MVINDLYEQARTGNKIAETELFKKLLDRFLVFAHQKVWNKESAEEIVQNALVTIHMEYRKIEITASFAAWCHKVIENKLLAHIQTRRRQNGRNVPLENIGPISDNWAPDPTLKMRLLGCLKKVARANRRYARILNLHYHGFNRDEVCGKLGMTMPQSYNVLSRARTRLKDCLDNGE